jgi:hypothetical protein
MPSATTSSGISPRVMMARAVVVLTVVRGPRTAAIFTPSTGNWRR